jgi:hypothetical protein
MGFYSNTRTTKGKGFYSQTSGSSSNGLDLTQLEALATAAGYTPPKPKGPGLLNKLFGLLSAGETAPAAYAALTGKDPLKAYGKAAVKGATLQGLDPEKKTYADVLKLMGVPEGKIAGPVSARNIAGLALDIGLDPTTYMGGWLAKLGIKGLKATNKLATKIPVAGKVLEAGENLISDVFIPGSKIKRELGETGAKYWDDWLKYVKGTRAEERFTIEGFMKQKKILEKAGVKPEDISALIENSGKFVPPVTKGAPIEKAGLYDTFKKTTDISNYDDLLAGKPSGADVGKSAKVVTMTPDEYLAQIPQSKPSQSSIDFMKAKLAKGEKLPMPTLDSSGGGFTQEGRNRAYLAKELGITEMPVLKVESVAQQPFSVPSVQGAEKGLAQETATKFSKILQGWGKQEQEAGLLKDTLDDYLSHTLTPEAREAIKANKLVANVPNPLMAKLNANKGRSLVGTIDEINKEFLKTHDYKLFDDDVFRIMSLRGVDHVKAVRTKEFMNAVETQFGREVTPETVNGMVEAGIKYVPYQPLGNKRFYKGVAKSGEEYLGMTSKVKTYLLPEEIAKHMSKATDLLTKDETARTLLKGYDKALGLWKSTVTSIFPAFHGRNLIGGMFNNWLAGISPLDPLYTKIPGILKEGTEGTMELGGKTYSYEVLRNMLKENGVLGQTGYMDVMKTMDELVKPKTGLRALTPNELGKKAMGAVENEVRSTLFIKKLAENGGDAYKASKEVLKFHFDYNPEGLTWTENEVFKRLMPFYTWTRNNIPLQLEQMAKQPGKYAGLGKTLRTLSGTTDADSKDQQLLPEYMKKGFPIKTGTDASGNPNYLYGLGLPVEDIGNLNPQQLGSMLSPVIKTPIEQLTKYNLFYQKPLDQVNSAPKVIAGLPEIIKKWLDYSETTKKDGTVSRKVNPAKWNLVTALMGRGIYTANSIFDSEVPSVLRGLYGLLGIKSKTLDMNTEEYWREQERVKQLEQFLLNKGVLKEFTRTYSPKK